jgi:hypothetical protein
MVTINENTGSGFETIKKFKGRFRLQDSLLYWGIYNNAIYTNSGHICIGFCLNFDDFKTAKFYSDFFNFYQDEFYIQTYLVYSKSICSLFLFLTFKYPYQTKFSSFQNLLFGISGKSARKHFAKNDSQVNRFVAELQEYVLSVFPRSTVLSDRGLNGFLNLILNKNLNEVDDITRYIYGDLDFKFSHYEYNGFKHVALKLRSYPKADHFSDLVFGSAFDFPFIIQTTITKPAADELAGLAARVGEAQEELRVLNPNTTIPTNSTGSLLHFDCAIHLFSKDGQRLVETASLLQKRFRDYGYLFGQECLELTNVVSSYFPGLAYLFQDRHLTSLDDLQFLLPFKKDSYQLLIKPEDRYPEFVPEAPPKEEEAIFAAPVVAVKTGAPVPGLPDEDDQARRDKRILSPEFEIGTKKDIIEDAAIAPPAAPAPPAAAGRDAEPEFNTSGQDGKIKELETKTNLQPVMASDMDRLVSVEGMASDL